MSVPQPRYSTGSKSPLNPHPGPDTVLSSRGEKGARLLTHTALPSAAETPAETPTTPTAPARLQGDAPRVPEGSTLGLAGVGQVTCPVPAMGTVHAAEGTAQGLPWGGGQQRR